MPQHTSVASTGAPQAAWLGQELALVFWQQDACARARLAPRVGRRILPRPHASVRLDAAGGRRVALLRLPRPLGAGSLLQLGPAAAGGAAVPAEAIAPLPDALIAALPWGGRARLLGFLLEMGVGLFRAGRDPAFMRVCGHLAASLRAAPDRAPLPDAYIAALLVDGTQLLVVPEGRAQGAWHLLGSEAIRRLSAGVSGDDVLLLASRAAVGDTLHGGGEDIRALAAPVPPPHILAWLQARPTEPATQAVRFLQAALAQERTEDGARAALLRELSLLLPRPVQRHHSAAHPVAAALDLALPDGKGGLFLRGWRRDPHALVQDMRLNLPWGSVGIPPTTLRHFARPDLVARFARAAHGGAPPSGFVAHLPDIGGAVPQPELVLGLASGAEIVLRPRLRTLAPAEARDAVLASVPHAAADAAMLEDCLGPAAARLHAAAMAETRAPEIVQLGTPPARPPVAVLIPIYRTLSFLRAQLACFACDPDWREVETIFVLDSPEQRAEVEHLLRGLHHLHGLALTLVVMPRNLGYAAANNAGAGIARAPLLLLLNSDVLPDQPGWLRHLAAPLADRRVGAVGPKLLFEDASIQHAGLFCEQDAEGIWFNRHYFKGFPRRFAAACRGRQVPGVTGAALLVRRALFEKVGGITEDYIIGDYEDSDFCLKLHAAGAVVAYAPAAELWHFERRSISTHQGYTRTLAALYNRRLHHARWQGALAGLMAGFGRRAAA